MMRSSDIADGWCAKYRNNDIKSNLRRMDRDIYTKRTTSTMPSRTEDRRTNKRCNTSHYHRLLLLAPMLSLLLLMTTHKKTFIQLTNGFVFVSPVSRKLSRNYSSYRSSHEPLLAPTAMGPTTTMQRVTCLFSKPTPEDRPADSASRRRSSGFRDNVKRLFTSRSIIGGSTSTSNDVSPSPPATDGKKAQEKPFNPHQSKVDLAFAPVEASLNELEESLRSARLALNKVKQESVAALEAMEMIAAVGGKESISAAAAEGENEEDLVDLSELTFDDIDYGSSAMAPPFLDPDSCLLPDAEPVVRIEKAPENSRRIFAGIDILASADDVWNVLTNYGELQNVIPNLVVNDVLELYDGSDETKSIDAIAGDEAVPEEVRCEKLANTKKGSLLRQVGGAKVAGIQFSARTTLEVREWPTGMPDFAHFLDDVWEGESREARAGVLKDTKLKRYRFPRPFCVGDKKLPTKDISMQSIVGDDGEFRLYQGVWRMQPLVGCSPPGKEAMRLTYAVEISPRPYLPVRLVEGRIVADLCSNLEAIRAAVTSP